LPDIKRTLSKRTLSILSGLLACACPAKNARHHALNRGTLEKSRFPTLGILHFTVHPSTAFHRTLATCGNGLGGDLPPHGKYTLGQNNPKFGGWKEYRPTGGRYIEFPFWEYRHESLRYSCLQAGRTNRRSTTETVLELVAKTSPLNWGSGSLGRGACGSVLF